MAQHFQVLKEKNYSLQILYSSKLSCRNEGEIMIFSNEAKLKVFVASKPTAKECLMEVPQTEMK